MKKALFIIPSLGMGGMERVLINYANLFVRNGYDVTVYNLTYDDPAMVRHLDSRIHYQNRYQPVRNIIRCSLKEITAGKFRILPFDLWMHFHSAEYLHRWYVTEHFDVEIAFYGELPIHIVGGASKDCRKIAFFHSTDLESYFQEHKQAFRRAASYYAKMDKKICVSQSVKEQYERVFGKGKDIFVVNNPNDTKRIRTLAAEEDVLFKTNFTFINVSRIYDRAKGILRLLHVCKRLNQEGFSYSVWIVGDGVDYTYVKQKAKEWELSNVTFFGQQENPYKFMKQADMYLCSSYYEGFSMTVSEAVTLGLPVLTTNVSGADEMLDGGEYGMIVDNSEEGIYEGMKTILSDSNFYQHYREKADERKDYLGEDAIMKQLENILYEEGK